MHEWIEYEREKWTGNERDDVNLYTTTMTKAKDIFALQKLFSFCVLPSRVTQSDSAPQNNGLQGTSSARYRTLRETLGMEYFSAAG